MSAAFVIRRYFPRPGSSGPATLCRRIVGTVGICEDGRALCEGATCHMRADCWAVELTCRWLDEGDLADWPVRTWELSGHADQREARGATLAPAVERAKNVIQ